MELSSKEGYLFSDDYRTGSNPFYHFPFKISKETQLTTTEFNCNAIVFSFAFSTRQRIAGITRVRQNELTP